MNQRRWLDQSQPQTLQIATMLLYINAVFLFLGGAFATLIGLMLVVAMPAAGYGIANEQRWGYGLGIGAAVVNVLWPLTYVGLGDIFNNVGLLLALAFDIALVALLVHPHSREYQRIWFS